MKQYVLRMEGTLCGRPINPGREVDEHELKRASKLYAEYQTIKDQLQALGEAREMLYRKYEHDGELVLNFNDELTQMGIEAQEDRLFEQREQVELYFFKLFFGDGCLEIDKLIREDE